MNTFWGETATRCMKKWYKDSKTVSHLRMLYVYTQDARAVLFILKRKGEQFEGGTGHQLCKRCIRHYFHFRCQSFGKSESFCGIVGL